MRPGALASESVSQTQLLPGIVRQGEPVGRGRSRPMRRGRVKGRRRRSTGGLARPGHAEGRWRPALDHHQQIPESATCFSGGSMRPSEQGRLRVVEQRVIEGLVGRDLRFVAGQVLRVVLVCHRGGRPAPCLAENRPQPRLRAHDGRVIQAYVRGRDRPQMIAITSRHPSRADKIAGQPGHSHSLARSRRPRQCGGPRRPVDLGEHCLSIVTGRGARRSARAAGRRDPCGGRTPRSSRPAPRAATSARRRCRAGSTDRHR